MNNITLVKKIFLFFIFSIFIFLVYIIIYKTNTFQTKSEHTDSLSTHFHFSKIGPLNYIHFEKKMRIANVPLTPLKSPYIQKTYKNNMPYYLKYKKIHLTEIEEQGLCGSCWVFSVCSMLSNRISMYTNRKISISVQYILQCYSKYVESNGCEGGSPESLLLWLSKFSLNLVSNYVEYNQENSMEIPLECPIKNKTSFENIFVKNNSVKSITRYVNEINPDPAILAENIKQMKIELINSGPFYSAIAVYEDFYDYSGVDIYKHRTGSLVGGHAIEIIGYCDPEKYSNYNGEGYWICRGSWVESWPTLSPGGYFKISMGKNECGIESMCGSALPSFPSEIPRDLLKFCVFFI